MRALPPPIADELTTLFHDVRLDDIDPDVHADFVIARVLENGTMKSVRGLVEFYGLPKIRSFFESGGALRVSPRTRALWLPYLRLTIGECTPKSSPQRRTTFWNP